MIKRLSLVIFSALLASCTSEYDASDATAYPLMSLFEAARSLDGERVEVVGYFGQWNGDIPVLYATRAAMKEQDVLYKSHILFKDSLAKSELKEMVEQLCFIEATIWYRGTVPTLDQAELIKCDG